jgi:ribose 5-phosphate isomerase B
MIIYVGADHRGGPLKEQLLNFLKGLGYETFDVHPVATPDDDYPDIAGTVARKVAEQMDAAKGILICGSGAGVDIVANKVKGIRSVLGINPDQVYDARHDDDVNVLSLSADTTEAEAAEKMTRVFLSTPFSGEERHARRLGKIKEIESWPAIV